MKVLNDRVTTLVWLASIALWSIGVTLLVVGTLRDSAPVRSWAMEAGIVAGVLSVWIMLRCDRVRAVDMMRILAEKVADRFADRLRQREALAAVTPVRPRDRS